MAAREVTYLSACIDCLAWLANGQVPEESTEWPGVEEIGRIWSGYHLVCSGPIEDENGIMRDPETGEPTTGEDWFSWSPCEVCGSRLGGSRNHAAAWRRAESTP